MRPLPCKTEYAWRMTMLSFRVEEVHAREAQEWAERLGVEKSELLREALRRHLIRLASEVEAEIWRQQPLTDDERSLTAVEAWAPAEDWADWTDAAR